MNQRRRYVRPENLAPWAAHLLEGGLVASLAVVFLVTYDWPWGWPTVAAVGLVVVVAAVFGLVLWVMSPRSVESLQGEWERLGREAGD